MPEAPHGLKVLDKSGRTVQLSWSAPYDGNSPVKRYLIEYKVSKGKDPLTFYLCLLLFIKYLTFTVIIILVTNLLCLSR